LGRGKYVSLWRTDGSEPDPEEDVMGFPWARFALLAGLLAGAGLAFAYHATATGVALALFAAVPGPVVIAWLFARARRSRDVS
jgi:CRISPR/Cas system-associated protein Csm6